MKSRPIVGVLVGGVVDIVATNLFALPVVLYAMAKFQVFGSPDAAHKLPLLMGGDPALFATMSVLGATASALGGYTAAWIARRNELLVGALSAYLCASFGIAALIHDTSGTPLVQHLAGFLLSPALGLLGGYVRQLQTRRLVRA